MVVVTRYVMMGVSLLASENIKTIAMLQSNVTCRSGVVIWNFGDN
jgi:hypothetical protein